MANAYVYDPRKQRPRKLRYVPKGDGKDWYRELYAVFCGTLIPREQFRPEWGEIHKTTARNGNPVNPEAVAERQGKESFKD
ncbi:hypothetical protein DLM76_17165 [Leptospira yasudae]|nr:hypothetical protein [Leptospira yasudae]RHX91457.1 hypothetical protein DLM76_17165 [Leptospira yasudae]